MDLRRPLLLLCLLALTLPVLLVVLFATGRLLAAMGDAGGELALDRAALVLTVLWGFDLHCLLIVLALHNLIQPPGPRE